MPTNWSNKMKVMNLQCHACGFTKPEGHFNEAEFLCESCYIEKFVPMEHLKPLPHRSLQSPGFPENLRMIGKGKEWLKNFFIQAQKWLHQKWDFFHQVG